MLLGVWREAAPHCSVLYCSLLPPPPLLPTTAACHCCCQAAPGRSWGPEQRKARVLAIPRELIMRATSPEDLARLGPEWAAWAAAAAGGGNASYAGLPEPGASIASRTQWIQGRAPTRVKWVEDGGAAYIVRRTGGGGGGGGRTRAILPPPPSPLPPPLPLQTSLDAEWNNHPWVSGVCAAVASKAGASRAAVLHHPPSPPLPSPSTALLQRRLPNVCS